MSAKPGSKAAARPRSPAVPTALKARQEALAKAKQDSSPAVAAAKPDSRARHRPAQSYSGPTTSYSSISERIDNLLREIDQKKNAEAAALQANPGKQLFSQSSRPKSRDQPSPKPQPQPAATGHRRVTSYSARPQPSAKPLEPEKTHTRKLSYDRVVKPKSIISKFAHRNDKGYLPDNPDKVNQDAYLDFANFAHSTDMHFFGVCDGHGFYGKEVSSYCKQRLPALLAQDPALSSNPRKALTNTILRTDSELLNCPFDVNFSGSTLNVVFILEKTLWCANVGDSRSIIARQLNEGAKGAAARQVGRHWMCIALSRDHKPDDKDESVRILREGGRIEAYQDEEGNPLGPARVWLQDQDIPGLAMSRSMGDAVAASVGVFSEPEILEFALTPEDKFLVCGSDGVFEFLSNEEIVKIVVPFWKANDVQGACDAVAQEARTRWTTVSTI